MHSEWGSEFSHTIRAEILVWDNVKCALHLPNIFLKYVRANYSSKNYELHSTYSMRF
jgi:hypothetical protein